VKNLRWQKPRTKKLSKYVLFERMRLPNLQKAGKILKSGVSGIEDEKIM
jgi:hypothetical protein